MIIGGLQKVSLIDYPGKVAAIVFTRGCPLRCHYCHNISLVLPELFAGPISEDYVMEFLETRLGKLDGVVITGGEPTIQKDLDRFMTRIKRMGYLIKLDTSGVNPVVLEALIGDGLVDYIAMDVKAPLGKYDEVTGAQVDQEAIRRSIGIIKGSGVDYEFRTTVVKGQLSEDDMVRIAESIAGSKRYMLQKFRKGETVDQAFRERDTYSDKEFDRIKNKVSRYVESCGVR